MEDRKVVIELQNVKRYFQVGSETVKALRGVSFKIYEGEFVTIQGTSGSGKSTLLNQLGCLDTPTSGEYFLDGISVRTMSKTQRAHLRNQKIGFVFQNYNLLAKTTAVENVELPLMYFFDYLFNRLSLLQIKNCSIVICPFACIWIIGNEPSFKRRTVCHFYLTNTMSPIVNKVTNIRVAIFCRYFPLTGKLAIHK